MSCAWLPNAVARPAGLPNAVARPAGPCLWAG